VKFVSRRPGATIGRDVVAAAYGVLLLHHALSLRAAGLNGKAPADGAALQQFVSGMTDNALWIIGTVATLAILVIGGLHFFGHSRAGDYAAKLAIGAVIIISAPGIAA
jgi:hypothetical protein